MTHAALNAIWADRAAFRAMWDLGLNWLGLNQGNPSYFGTDKHLILRRWPGNKYPMPEDGPAVGFARNALAVSSSSGVAYAANTAYWHRVDRVSGGGVIAPNPELHAQPAIWGAAGYAGFVPNRPTWLDVSQTPDNRARLTWRYNPVGEQIAPTDFKVFTDSGTGTVSATPYATIDYIDGRELYEFETDIGVGDSWLWQVRSRSVAGVYSWWGTTPHPGIDQGVAYSPTAVSAKVSVKRAMLTASPAAPSPPEFR